MNNKICPYQHYTSRCFEASIDGAPTDASGPELRATAEAFVAALEKQTGLDGYFPITISDVGVDVDLDEWPEGEGFGEWFRPLMEQHGVEVYD